ncbi:MAG: hypothetical protein CM15mP101_06280 [Flavobacteriaceae bacterium]|jgi:hypothetical protein|nr:MAG: hypothetical protein CM15mP101_06280 [Flavobacteriaceae bacterium]
MDNLLLNFFQIDIETRTIELMRRELTIMANNIPVNVA